VSGDTSDAHKRYAEAERLSPEPEGSGEARDTEEAEAAEAADAEAGHLDTDPQQPDAPGPTDAAASAAASDPRTREELVDALAEAERQRDEYLEAVRRERAEFENFRRRSHREHQEARDKGAEQLTTTLLPALDNIDHVAAAAESSADHSLAKGVSMVASELFERLEEAGLAEVPGVGAPFDPNVHEAMTQVEAEEETDKPYVAEVYRKGWQFNGRLLRAASVSVAQ